MVWYVFLSMIKRKHFSQSSDRLWGFRMILLFKILVYQCVALLPAIGSGLMWSHTYEDSISSTLLGECRESYICCLGDWSYLQLVNWVFWSPKYWCVESFTGCRRYKAVEAWSMFWMWWILMSFYTRNWHTLSQGLRDSCSDLPYLSMRGPYLCILVIICPFVIIH